MICVGTGLKDSCSVCSHHKAHEVEVVINSRCDDEGHCLGIGAVTCVPIKEDNP